LLPDSIQIGAHRYRIEVVPPEELNGSVADVDNKKNLIRVDEEASRSRQIGLLLHECLHAMVVGYDYKDEERMVITLEEALTRFIQDNPLFIQQACHDLADEKNKPQK